MMSSLVWLFAESMAAILIMLAVVILASSRADLPLPFAGDLLAARLSETLDGPEFAIGRLDLTLARSDGFAGVTAREVRLTGQDGTPLLSVPRVETRFTLADLMRGDIRPETITIFGADARVRRLVSGGFSLSLGAGQTAIAPGRGAVPRDLNAYVQGTEFLREVPELSKLSEIRFSGVKLVYADDSTGRSWLFDRGELMLAAGPLGYRALISGGLPQAGGRRADVKIEAKQDVATGNSQVVATFSGASPVDLADQIPALGWLRVLDAPLDAELDLLADAAGRLKSMAGTLELGSGEISAESGPSGLKFQEAHVNFTFDPDRRRFTIPELSVTSDAVTLAGRGQMTANLLEGPGNNTLAGQFALSDVRLPAPGGGAPIAFAEGRLSLKLTASPFTAEVGEFVLFDSERWLGASGRIVPGRGDYAADVRGRNLGREDLLALWPAARAERARAWVIRNISSGRITDLAGGFRPGGFYLGFGCAGVRVRFLPFMPEAEGAACRGALDGESFDLTLLGGRVPVPGKGPVELAGTRLYFPDIRAKPAPLAVTLRARGGLGPVLDLIDRDPLRLLARAGATAEIAEGEAEVVAELGLPVKRGLGLQEISFVATAHLSALRSDRLVAGRVLTADALKLHADGGGLSISGEAALDGLPLDFVWQKPLGQKWSEPARLTAGLAISAPTLALLGAELPEGAVKGQARGELSATLGPVRPAAFTLTADLGPLALRIPALGWSKAAGEAGSFRAEGVLSDPPLLDDFSLATAGLEAEGRLAGATPLAGLSLDRLAVGSWLDTAMTWRPGEARFTGGVIDLKARGGSSGTGGGMRLVLDGTDIRAATTINLVGARGTIAAGAQAEGVFEARVNGGTEVAVQLTPTDAGQRIVVNADDAAGVLRDAGLFRSALGGSLRLALVEQGAPGNYRGAFEIGNIRVRDAPVLAALLSAASIIGFLEQLDGNGLSFTTVSGRFTVEDGLIRLSEAKAVGPSIGISLKGTYDPSARAFDMTGVISPLYAINGIFAEIPLIGRILGGREGEGLIGFGYTLRGSADAPRISVNPLSILTPGALREIFEARPGAAAPQPESSGQ
jgi:hypothetical protein